MKLYTVKSSAHRAAKQAGLEKEQYEIVEVDGRFGFQPIEVAEEPVQEAPAEVEAIEAPAKGEAKPEVKHKSDIERPTKAVWHIADEMSAANPQVRRKDVIAECVRRGIAFYTARTQYQQWLATKKGSTK
jgi:hypothetical protein